MRWRRNRCGVFVTIHWWATEVPEEVDGPPICAQWASGGGGAGGGGAAGASGAEEVLEEVVMPAVVVVGGGRRRWPMDPQLGPL